MNTKGYIDNRADMGRETSASNRHPELEIDFRSPHPLPEIPELHRLEAEHLAREVYVMTLLRHHDISAGRAAMLLGIDRWQLSDLMDRYGICPFTEQTVAELEREVDRLKLSLGNEETGFF